MPVTLIPETSIVVQVIGKSLSPRKDFPGQSPTVLACFQLNHRAGSMKMFVGNFLLRCFPGTVLREVTTSSAYVHHVHCAVGSEQCRSYFLWPTAGIQGSHLKPKLPFSGCSLSFPSVLTFVSAYTLPQNSLLIPSPLIQDVPCYKLF